MKFIRSRKFLAFACVLAACAVGFGFTQNALAEKKFCVFGVCADSWGTFGLEKANNSDSDSVPPEQDLCPTLDGSVENHGCPYNPDEPLVIYDPKSTVSNWIPTIEFWIPGAKNIKAVTVKGPLGEFDATKARDQNGRYKVELRPNSPALLFIGSVGLSAVFNQKPAWYTISATNDFGRTFYEAVFVDFPDNYSQQEPYQTITDQSKFSYVNLIKNCIDRGAAACDCTGDSSQAFTCPADSEKMCIDFATVNGALTARKVQCYINSISRPSLSQEGVLTKSPFGSRFCLNGQCTSQWRGAQTVPPGNRSICIGDSCLKPKEEWGSWSSCMVVQKQGGQVCQRVQECVTGTCAGKQRAEACNPEECLSYPTFREYGYYPYEQKGITRVAAVKCKARISGTADNATAVSIDELEGKMTLGNPLTQNCKDGTCTFSFEATECKTYHLTAYNTSQQLDGKTPFRTLGFTVGEHEVKTGDHCLFEFEEEEHCEYGCDGRRDYICRKHWSMIGAISCTRSRSYKKNESDWLPTIEISHHSDRMQCSQVVRFAQEQRGTRALPTLTKLGSLDSLTQKPSVVLNTINNNMMPTSNIDLSWGNVTPGSTDCAGGALSCAPGETVGENETESPFPNYPNRKTDPNPDTGVEIIFNEDGSWIQIGDEPIREGEVIRNDDGSWMCIGDCPDPGEISDVPEQKTALIGNTGAALIGNTGAALIGNTGAALDAWGAL